MDYYTGIGSRKTPDAILSMMIKYGKILSSKFILRSGGADGADTAFETGCDLNNGLKEIYLPFKNFNGNSSEYYNVSSSALELANSIFPENWKTFNKYVKRFHGRNVYQVLGYNLDCPSKFVICWTPNGKYVGGTRTAMMLANKYNIPVYNLAIENNIKHLDENINLLLKV